MKGFAPSKCHYIRASLNINDDCVALGNYSQVAVHNEVRFSGGAIQLIKKVITHKNDTHSNYMEHISRLCITITALH